MTPDAAFPSPADDPPDATGLSPDAPPLHVVATAGHVDHGKSALVLRLTGIDPDRLEEEKRRGLTIDLGFAWTVLPSGREIGFVDVPGHERFIRNMLAGVGPVRLVLFVVAADEGWKPQSEEHLQIVDVLGAAGAVVALTKSDLVDRATLAGRVDQTARRLSATRLEGVPIIPCSSITGEGIDTLVKALDEMVAGAAPPERTERPRQFIDRVFTIRGAGTVVTGTLTGGVLGVGQEVEVLPSQHRARIRGLQTHKRTIETALPVSRVAVNLAGTPKTDLERGDVLALPGQWRPTTSFEGSIRPVRGLGHRLTARGAYKLYAGSAERDARIRLYGTDELGPGREAFARITLSRSVVLDFKDSFVLREAGRQETVAGGLVLDVDPPVRPGPDPAARLRARMAADRHGLAWRLVSDGGVIRASEVLLLAGVPAAHAEAQGAVALGPFLCSPEVLARAERDVGEHLSAYHAIHPLRPGIEISEARALLHDRLRLPGHADPALVDALIDHMAEAGLLARHGTILRLPHHRPSTVGREEADRLVEAVRRAEPTPPLVKQLTEAGFSHELIAAACAEGRLARVSADIVATPDLIARAEALVRTLGVRGEVTVSAFREALGTSRKYALPILEYLDAKGVTRRQGDARVVRG